MEEMRMNKKAEDFLDEWIKDAWRDSDLDYDGVREKKSWYPKMKRRKKVVDQNQLRLWNHTIKALIAKGAKSL
jgi:hypothetical protein